MEDSPICLNAIAPLEDYHCPSELHPDSFDSFYAYVAACLEHPGFQDLIRRLTGKPAYSTINPAERAFLYLLTCKAQTRNVLEIGTYFAGTAQLLALAAVKSGGRRVYTIDPQGGERASDLIAQWPSVLAEIVTFRPLHSCDFLGPLSNIPNFDLIFIDGNHRYPNVLHDLYASDENLLPGGVMVADNAEQPDVMDAVRHFVRDNPGYEAIIVSNFRATEDRPARREVSRHLRISGAASEFALLRKPKRTTLTDRNLPYRIAYPPGLKAPVITVAGIADKDGQLGISVTMSYMPRRQEGQPKGYSASSRHVFDVQSGEFRFEFAPALSLPDEARREVTKAEVNLSSVLADGSIYDLRVWWGDIEIKPHRNFLGT